MQSGSDATWRGWILPGLVWLRRRKLAEQVNLTVLAGMALTFTCHFLLSDGLKIMGGKATGTLVFTAVIVVIGVLLYVYSRTMRRRGVRR